jgi:hypothetical protein
MYQAGRGGTSGGGATQAPPAQPPRAPCASSTDAPAWPKPGLSPPTNFDGDGILALCALAGSSPTGASGPPALGGSTVSVHLMAVRLRPHHE